MKILWKREMPVVLVAVFLLVIVAFPPQASCREQIFAGDSIIAVTQKMGTPDNHIENGSQQLLFYGATVIELMDGLVTRINGRPAPRPEMASRQDSDRADDAASDGPVNAPKVIDIRKKGQAIDIRKLLVKRGITVVAFYADW